MLVTRRTTLALGAPAATSTLIQRASLGRPRRSSSRHCRTPKMLWTDDLGP
jgi:hypothetical protein